MGAPEEAPAAARRWLVSGRVQGVGFRHSTTLAVAELGGAGHAVRGWVRNLRDGRVEVHGEGTDAALDALAAWLAQGPRYGRVDEVLAREAEFELCSGFEVRATPAAPGA